VASNGRGAGPPDETITVQSIQVEGVGIPDEELLANLPALYVNQRVSRKSLSSFEWAVHEVDEHLVVSVVFLSMPPNSIAVRILAPNAVGTRERIDEAVAAIKDPAAIPVAGRVQDAKLKSAPCFFTSGANPVRGKCWSS
jgi:hypothetical protein